MSYEDCRLNDTMTRRTLTLVLLGLGGYALLLFFAVRLSPTRALNYQLDRRTAIEAARETASRFDINAREWTAYATAEHFTTEYHYLMTKPSAANIVALAPVRTFVKLIEPQSKNGQSISVTLDAGGRAIGFTHRLDEPIFGEKATEGNADTNADNADAGNNSNQSIEQSIESNDNSNTGSASAAADMDAAQARARVGQAFAGLIGDAAWKDFKAVSETDSGDDKTRTTRLTWERRTDDAPEVTMRAIGEVKGGRIADLKIEPNFSPTFNDATDNRRSFNGIVSGISGFSTFLIVLAAIGFYVLALTRRKLTFVLPLILFGLIAVTFTLNRVLYGSIDGSMSSPAMGLPVFFSVLQIGLGAAFVGLGFALMWSVGYVYARRTKPLKIASFAALLRGKLTTRFVARAVAYGILCGGIVACVPYFIKATTLFPMLELDRIEAEYLVSRAPAVAALIQPVDFVLFSLFAFVIPVIASRTRLARLAPIMVFIIGGVWMMTRVSSLSSYAMIIVGVASILILLEIYRRFDLLTLIVTTLAAQSATVAALLLVTSSASLQASAWCVFASLAFITIVGLVIGARGRDANIEAEVEPDLSANDKHLRVERERLVADFSIARQAQQRMLPDAPPQIPGYEISATCRPAREVGGDLYDFLRLPDERVGIVVADVSGKGIPAALYMTLTKGLLASIAEHESDPKLILQEVNRHLYEVCRRKMFVTLVLAILDPATRRLTYARAGHNPPVWRKSATNETLLLRAPGLGLGLNKGKLFDATLKPETITLERGDCVVFYSDGITEAMNESNTEYDEQRLMHIIERADGLNADATQENVMEDVGMFLGEVHPQDDQTVVVLRVSGDD